MSVDSKYHTCTNFFEERKFHSDLTLHEILILKFLGRIQLQANLLSHIRHAVQYLLLTSA